MGFALVLPLRGHHRAPALAADGRASVDLLLALVAALDAPSEQIVLPTQMIVRESTLALRGRRRAGAPSRPAAASPLR